jgi:hypothetical protein
MIRRMIPVSYTREQAVGMTAFCRKYMIIGQHGEPRGVEAVRLLLVVGLSPGAEARTRAVVAAQINLKSMMATVGGNASGYFARNNKSDEPEMIVKPRLFVRIDTWLANQLSIHARDYRDGNGGVLDNKMVYEFTLRGLMDPDLHAVATTYSKLIYPMRSRILQLTEAFRESVQMIEQEWTKSMGELPMPETLAEGG